MAKNSHKTIVDLWIDYAKEYLGETNYLKHNKVCINYNQWFADIEYRREIAEKLQVKFSDAGIDKVTVFGGGSSFEGKQFDGKATSMDVLNRWHKFCDYPQYKQFFNEEVLKYSEKIFGHIPGTESFLIVSSDSGIPLFMRTGDGNESDKAVFGQILSNVKKQIKLDSIMVYDSGLLSLKTSN